MRISDWSSDVCSSDLDRFLLDSRQTADARADRNASAVTLFVAHVGEAGILQRLAGGVYAVDDERIDLPLHLVVDALAGIEAVFVVGRLYLARDMAGIVGRIEPRDPGGAAFRSEEIGRAHGRTPGTNAELVC